MPRSSVVPVLVLVSALLPAVPGGRAHAAAGPDRAPAAGATDEVSPRELRELRARLGRAVREQDDSGAQAVLEALDGRAGADSIPLVPRVAALVPSAATHDAAVRIIARLESGGSALSRLLKLVEDDRADPRLRTVVLDGLAERSDRATLEAVLGTLESDDHRVLVAAVRAAASRRSRDALLPLVRILERRGSVQDRVWSETRRALFRLTGQSLEDAEAWRKLVESLPPDWAPGRAVAGEDRRTEVAGGTFRFFDRTIASRNLVFVIDTSGSMGKWDPDPDYEGGNPERDLMRLRVAQRQLVKSLRALPRTARFNIIAYNDEVTPWSRQLRRATRSAVRSATRFVAGLEAKSNTHTDEALAKAYEDPVVDTIVLLSDGAPFKKGEATALGVIEETVAQVEDLTPLRKVRIHTFGFTGAGKWPASVREKRNPPSPPSRLEVQTFVRFLERLAEATGGRFHDLAPES